MPRNKAAATTALAKLDMDVLALPEGVELLPDTRTHQHRFDFVSASGSEYRIAQTKPNGDKGGWWACSCPSYIHGRKGHKDCKHLRDFGLPGNYAKFEIGGIQVGALEGEVGAQPMKTEEAAKRKAAGKRAAQLRALPGGRDDAVVDPSSKGAVLTFLVDHPDTYRLKTEIKALGGRARYEGGKFKGWLMPSAEAKAEVEALLAAADKKAASKKKAAPKALPSCSPTNIEMVDGKIVVTFDAEDQAAVFALLSQLSPKPE